MTCADGQTNINTASVDELVGAFGLDTAVATRLVGYRPYLTVNDLLVVEGIGADKLSQIQAAGRGCSTPISSPPPALSPCASTDKVDLQSATADQVSRVTGVNKNAAERLIAARPFASLRHITPERVPGVGKGILDTIVARSCLTPQPIRDAGTSWRWGYPAYTTTASRDGYALTAPAGVIDATSGAWLSITPLGTPSTLPGPAYPRADLHIHGAWTGPREPGGAPDEVLATVPAATFADDFDAAEYKPYIKHISPEGVPGGGENVYDSSKATVDPTTGAVTASLTSLSIVEWATRALNFVIEPAEGVLFGNRFPAPNCSSPWAQRPNIASYVSPTGAHADLTGALLNLPGNTPPVGGFLIKHCVQDGPGTGGYNGGKDARTLLRNTSGTVQVLKPYVGDVTVSEQGGSTPEFDIVKLLVTRINTGGNTYLGPGDAGTADVPAGTMGSVRMQPDRLRSLLKVGGDKTLGMLFDKLGANKMYSDPMILNWIAQMSSCLYNSYNSLTSRNGFANTARDFATALYGCFDYEGIYALIERWMRDSLASGTLDGAGAVRINKGLENMREAFKWIEFGQIAVDVSDSLIWGSLPDSPILIEHYAARPSRDDLGRTIQPACISPYLYTWHVDMNCQNAAYSQQQQPTGGGGDTGVPLGKMIRDPDGHAWLVTTADQKMHPIGDGGTYICLSKHYAIDWDVDSDDLAGYIQASGPEGDNATCDGSLPPTRKITKQAAPNLFAVLRINGGPESWIVMGGSRWPIPSGGEFNCWVNPQYRANIEVDVFDFVSPADLETWPIGNGSISNCGDPENPTF
ncbi:Helix-hairpin-helix motif-containing protein [Micromonospora chersina]|uniref:Helix-hairpin-helix motif-containing protein n=2 Tax=Micromonospora chersina TaxID=47854 RepID=A0A1C6U9C0_9ACTN|nr:Helix-hairpin-helix motif-containing protein [Micromonospora chersina]